MALGRVPRTEFAHMKKTAARLQAHFQDGGRQACGHVSFNC